MKRRVAPHLSLLGRSHMFAEITFESLRREIYVGAGNPVIQRSKAAGHNAGEQLAGASFRSCRYGL